MIAVTLPLLVALASQKTVAFSVSVPWAVIRMAELQAELMFNEDFSLALQGAVGEPTVDRTRASDLPMFTWGTGLQLRGWFYGGASRGGAYAGAAGHYTRSDEPTTSLLVQIVGAGAIGGYKWAWSAGPFVDLNLGAGYGYYSAESDTEGAEDGSQHSVYPFVNLNVGWAF